MNNLRNFKNLYLLRRLRDEVHRFAITRMRQTSVEELASLPGMTETAVKEVKAALMTEPG